MSNWVSEVEPVESQRWCDAIAAALADGWQLTWLGAEDDIGQADTFTVYAVLVRYGDGCASSVSNEVSAAVAGGVSAAVNGRTVAVTVDRNHPVLPSLVSVAPCVGWYEREIHDLFGIDFIADMTEGDPGEGVNATPPVELLWHRRSTAHYPLRKDVVLGARVATDWPGESAGDVQESARRRTKPPGVPASEVWGERALGVPSPAPNEIVESLTSARPSRGARTGAVRDRGERRVRQVRTVASETKEV